MSRNTRDLQLVAGLALAALACALLGELAGPLRFIFGLPLVFVLPGYALTAALFPRHLEMTEQALYSLVMSLVAVILSGFLLNKLPWGLQATSWALWLTALTLAACAVAWWRRPATTRDEAVDRQQSFPLGLGQGLLIALTIIVVAGAIGLARSEAQQRPAADVVQLWMLPGEEDGVVTLRVGVNSIGPAEGKFRLRLQRSGYTIREWPLLTLTPGAQWADTVVLKGRQPGKGAFEARLYRNEEQSVVFRSVSVWLEEK